MKSRTMNGTPPSSPASYTDTIAGWRSGAELWASSMKRVSLLVIGEVAGTKHLHRDDPLELRVEGPVDRAERAGADRLDQLESANPVARRRRVLQGNVPGRWRCRLEWHVGQRTSSATIRSTSSMA